MEVGEVVQELLNSDKTAIAIDPGFGPAGFFDISKSVVVSWGVMAFLMILTLIMTSGLKVHNISKRQLIIETAVVKLKGLIASGLGEEAKEYTAWITTLLIFLGFSNLVGLIGVTPATMDLNVTAALAIMSIVLVQIASIRKKGGLGWLKSFAQPLALITPMNILELGIKPLSLCMRLFGNILAATVIMEMLKAVVPVFVPAVFCIYFDLFDGLLQAYVFVFLTSLYIKEAVE
ncbi:MAG: F0F1 ATP synthase subunit A [Lachnospiraceae bacterium]|nr:F0F1 ATP synthase subunit A [Lachnospiraceae bacterium]